jgi:hypothetical protein
MQEYREIATKENGRLLGLGFTRLGGFFTLWGELDTFCLEEMLPLSLCYVSFHFT